jgi:multisubunit Na+/H+ antiporter MnhC subunit
MEYRDMPEPLPLRKVLGPSVILAGVGVGSGEYILWPYISSNAGIGFLYLAVVGVTIQYFLNMEIERYTLATGETAIAGFARSWKPWGVLFCVFAVVPNIWPGWGTAGATTASYLFGGNPTVIAIGVLVAIGVALSLSRVVYRFLEGAEFFKVGLTIVFLAIAVVAGIKASAWSDLQDNAKNVGTLPTSSVAVATLLAGLVFAGAGGTNNLVQSNWIREKGFGMGAYVPKIESPITGEPEPQPTTGSMVRQDEENIGRFRQWFRVASKEQLVSFWAICVASIIVFSVLAYSTTYGQNLSDEADFDFIKAEGNVLKDVVGPWFGTFFWLFGSISLMLVALGVVDYVSRLVADALKTLHLRDNARWSESKIYATVVWTMCLLGIAVLASGFDQPLVLLVLSACLNGIVMFIYSILLIKLNRGGLPSAIRVRGLRLGVLGFAVVFYGFFAGWYVITQMGELF